MIDRLEVQNQQDSELKKELEKIDWRAYTDYGAVKLTIRNGRVTLVTIERTLKLD